MSRSCTSRRSIEGDPEALQTVLERAHDPVVAVVEHRLELEAADPLVLDRAGFERPAQQSSDLGRDDEVVALLAIERPAEAMLGLPAAVPGRGVEIAHAAVPRRSRRSPPPRRPRPCRTDRRAAPCRGRARDTETPVRPSLRVGNRRRAHSSGSVPNRKRVAFGRAGFRPPRRLGLGDVAGEDGDDADPLAVRGHHHIERLRLVQPEHGLEHLHHEVARRVVVVEQNDLVQARTLGAASSSWS